MAGERPAAGWELRPGDADYPAGLRELADPPRTLYGFGDPTLLAPDSIAIVGARRATPYGLWAADLFGAWAGGNGVTVVSGAARGCDAAAQSAACDAGGRSVAVLGCGADIDYPRTNRPLIDRLRREGAVVSEAPWGAQPVRWAFARRNRIIAGLARALLIVEAALPSGTFSTADHALDLGRTVLAVPGSIRSPESRGTNRLIAQGAVPIFDVGDLADVLGVEPSAAPAGAAADDPLVSALLAEPARADDLAWHLGLDARTVAARLSRLASSGLASRLPDGRWAAGREVG
jgi:DNA processing protein